MPQTPIIIFVCEHGAAKSVVGAAHFNKLARAGNLRFHAIARGTHPDQELSPVTITGLLEDGLTPTETVPRKLSLADVESAQRVVTFCELPEEYKQKASVEQWNGVPPMSENYEQARDAIIERINTLIHSLS
jgi:protein-tyrosine-phosphatase